MQRWNCDTNHGGHYNAMLGPKLQTLEVKVYELISKKFFHFSFSLYTRTLYLRYRPKVKVSLAVRQGGGRRWSGCERQRGYGAVEGQQTSVLKCSLSIFYCDLREAASLDPSHFNRVELLVATLQHYFKTLRLRGWGDGSAVKACSVLSKDPRSIPSTHVRCLTTTSSSSFGNPVPASDFHKHCVHMCACAHRSAPQFL